MNFKLKIGLELKALLDARKDMDEIALWADEIYAHEKIDQNLDDLLFSLSALTLEGFHRTNEELYQIATNLILEGEKEDLSLAYPDSQKATIIDACWIMCPICQESWEEYQNYKMTRCPSCKSKLYNPISKKP